MKQSNASYFICPGSPEPNDPWTSTSLWPWDHWGGREFFLSSLKCLNLLFAIPGFEEKVQFPSEQFRSLWIQTRFHYLYLRYLLNKSHPYGSKVEHVPIEEQINVTSMTISPFIKKFHFTRSILIWFEPVSHFLQNGPCFKGTPWTFCVLWGCATRLYGTIT